MFSSLHRKWREVAGGLLLAALGTVALVAAEPSLTGDTAEASGSRLAATGMAVAIPILLVSTGLQP